MWDRKDIDRQENGRRTKEYFKKAMKQGIDRKHSLRAPGHEYNSASGGQ